MLKKLRDGPPAHVRLGISPQLLREGMDRVFPPTSAENVNVRAMLAVGLQGLMRGRNSGARARLTRRATSRAGSGRMHGAEARDVHSSGEGQAPPSGKAVPW